MNNLTQENLNTLLEFLNQTLIEGKTFILNTSPQLIQNLVSVKRLEYIMGIVITLAIIIFTILVVKSNNKHRDDLSEIQEGLEVGLVLFGIVSTISLILMLLHSIAWFIHPDVAVFKCLISWVR